MTRRCSVVMTDLLADHTELFKQFSDNPSFKKWLQRYSFWAKIELGSNLLLRLQ
jgi:type I restriction enzyme R subunit